MRIRLVACKLETKRSCDAELPAAGGLHQGNSDAATRDHRRWHHHAWDGGGGRAWPTADPRGDKLCRVPPPLRRSAGRSISRSCGAWVFRQRWEQVFCWPRCKPSGDDRNPRCRIVACGSDRSRRGGRENLDLGHRPGCGRSKPVQGRRRLLSRRGRYGRSTRSDNCRQPQSARFPNADRTRGIRQSRLYRERRVRCIDRAGSIVAHPRRVERPACAARQHRAGSARRWPTR